MDDNQNDKGVDLDLPVPTVQSVPQQDSPSVSDPGGAQLDLAISQPKSQSPAQPQPQPQSQPDPLLSTPAVAEDDDLIEKEWVKKAKNIIDKTKDDPFTQSNEMSLFKADYIKKRYNKTIKTSE